MKAFFSKRAFVVALSASLITTISVLSAHADTTPKGKPFIAINDQIIEVEGAISSIEDQIELLVGHVETIEEKVLANESAIIGLQAQDEVLFALIDQNLNEINAILTEIDTLKAANTYLQSMIEVNSGDINTLRVEIADNEALIITLQDAILMIDGDIVDIETSLQEQIDHNKLLIGVLEDQIEQFNLDIATKQNLVNGICPETGAIGEINPDGSVVCNDTSISSALGIYRVWHTFTVPNYRTASIRIYCKDGDIPMSVGFSHGDGLVNVRRAYISGTTGKLNGYVVAESYNTISNASVMALIMCAQGAERTIDNP